MAEKTFNNVRLGLKIDTLENWKNSSLVLKRGEIAICTVAASVGTGLEEPVCMIKIGDGEKTFSQLGFDFYAKASDVLAACKSEEGLTAFINTVIANANLASSADMEALAGRVETAEGEIDTLQSEMDAVEKKADDNAAAIETLNGLVGDEEVATQISNAIADLNLAETYEVKGAAADALAEAKSYADGKDEAIAAAKKAGDDAQAAADKAQEEVDALETYVGTIPTGYSETNVIAYINKKAEETLTAANGGSSESAASVAAALEAYKAENDPKVQANTDAIAAIEADYLKAADKTALQEQITANDGEIAALQGLVGDEEVSKQISDAIADKADKATTLAGYGITDGMTKTEIEQAIEDAQYDDTALEGRIKANEDAIGVLNGNSSVEGSVDKKVADAINAFATAMSDDDTVNTYKELIDYAAEHGSEFTELVGVVDGNTKAIATLNGDASTAGSVDKKIADAIAAENLGQYATDDDLAGVAGRVTTAEGEIDQLQTDVDALEALIGDTDVATQISDAIEDLDLANTYDAKGAAATVQGALDEYIEANDAAVALKANDADLAAIAKSGNVNDLIQTEGDVIIFDCGTSAV